MVVIGDVLFPYEFLNSPGNSRNASNITTNQNQDTVTESCLWTAEKQISFPHYKSDFKTLN